MEADPTQSFNQKLSQWIASQGFWFQLRHSISTGGGWATTMNHLLRLSVKLLVALAVAAAVFAGYLVKRVDSASFVQSLDEGIAAGLSASEAHVKDFARIQGTAHIHRVGVVGSDKSIFKSLEAGNIRFKMGLLSGLGGKWEAGTLQAKWMRADLKGGADSAEQASALADALFRQWPGFEFSSLQVDETSLRWGYSPQTSGRIDKSNLVVTRSLEGWRLVFQGGTFSQNWLKDLEISELELNVSRSGIKVAKGIFKSGNGSVTLRDFAVAGGERPQFSGFMELSGVELATLIPKHLSQFLEGVISTELTVSGSTNTTEGVEFEGDVKLSDENYISLREKFELLKLLSVVDVYQSYRKVDFKRGGFRIKTGGGSLKLNRVDLQAGELMTMQGLIEVRYPTHQEIGSASGLRMDSLVASAFDTEMRDGGDEITLAKAAKAEAESNSKGSAIFSRFAQERIDELKQDQELERRSQALMCTGGMTITIPGDAFDRSERLREVYPIDAETGRIKLDVPLDGVLYELTRRQAEEIRLISEER